jgi:AcrR family transcriptional regulator
MTKRDAICDAALELFAKKGIEATTTREIAERADAAEGTLYRHFDGKDDLARWLHRRCANQLREMLVGAVGDAMTAEERLEALVRGVFDFFAARPTACTYLLSTRPPEGDGEPAPSPTRHFTDALEQGVGEGAFDVTSTPLVAGWILAMVQRTVLFLKTETLPMEREAAIDRTVSAVFRLVGANEED